MADRSLEFKSGEAENNRKTEGSRGSLDPQTEVKKPQTRMSS